MMFIVSLSLMLHAGPRWDGLLLSISFCGSPQPVWTFGLDCGLGKPALTSQPRKAVFRRRNTSLSVILALVAGIQRPDVRRVKKLLSPKDLGGWIPVTSTGMAGSEGSVFLCSLIGNRFSGFRILLSSPP
jgi:hypothetical protein